MKFLLLALLAYLAYQFIFNLVIPVYRTTTKIKKGFREMHERMQAQQGQDQANFATDIPNDKNKTRPDPRDYIEFEEVK